MTDAATFETARSFLVEEGLPGWLVYDYSNSNPIFHKMVQPSGHLTRPRFLFVPDSGEPRLLVHHVDAGKFAQCGIELSVYRNRDGMVQDLGMLLSRSSKVAMEYSPQGVLPRASKVDAGTVELVRSLGVSVVSSADLTQYVTQRWTQEQLEGHQHSANKLGQIVNDAFQYTAANLADGPTEYQVAEFIRRRFREEALESPDGPIVALNAHASDPHYEPSAQGSSSVNPGDWMLIDLWAKPSGQDSVYADITWVAHVGASVPERHQEIFDIVVGARDAALQHLKDAHQQGTSVQGWQADATARTYIGDRGYGEFFTHRLGHSIGQEVHGDAVNLDGFETQDTRRIIPGIGFSIEPGIYLPEFGVRSEIDVFMAETGPIATSPVQKDVVLINRT